MSVFRGTPAERIAMNRILGTVLRHRFASARKTLRTRRKLLRHRELVRWMWRERPRNVLGAHIEHVKHGRCVLGGSGQLVEPISGVH
jgi:hypothetical protein